MMEVFYKAKMNIIDKLDQVEAVAMSNEETIDKVELTHSEAWEFFLEFEHELRTESMPGFIAFSELLKSGTFQYKKYILTMEDLEMKDLK